MWGVSLLTGGQLFQASPFGRFRSRSDWFSSELELRSAVLWVGVERDYAYLVYELTTSWLIAHTRMERASNHCGDTSRTLEVVSPMK